MPETLMFICIIGLLILLACFILCMMMFMISARADKANQNEWRKYLIERRGRP